jgi:uncharacterized membrane protein
MKTKRTIYKALSWETSSNLVCLGIAYLVWGNIGSCILFTLVCVAIKLAGYCLHEMLWEG